VDGHVFPDQPIKLIAEKCYDRTSAFEAVHTMAAG